MIFIEHVYSEKVIRELITSLSLILHQFLISVYKNIVGRASALALSYIYLISKLDASI